jgi:sugar lactone lactonase YvrE
MPLLVNPETIIFGNDGTMYIINEDAKLVSLHDFQPLVEEDTSILTATAIEVADLGHGRPLGGKFDNNGCLYFADAIFGLNKICNLLSKQGIIPSSSVEVVASQVKLDDGTFSPINYADDVDIGPRTGHVYFSDASNIKPDRNIHGKWDIMYASKIEALRGNLTGRLLRYMPETGAVDILATGVPFANGVAVDVDEEFVLYTSSFDASIRKYHLDGSGEERMQGVFPGVVDGADCSFQTGLCYIAIPAPLSPLVSAIFAATPWLSRHLRSLVMMLPRMLSPPAQPYGGVAEIQPGDKNNIPAFITRLFQDPDGRDFTMITGVTEHEGKLYLGSLHANYVGVVSLS